MAAISQLVKGCLAQFTSIINSGALSDHTEVSQQDWTDELGRLRVWAANIGAHQTRQSSLDYRLRDASHIKSQIVRLLEGFQELLTDLEDVLGEESDDEAKDDRLQHLDDMSGSESSTTEIQEVHQGLMETINQLYQMSMIIRKPAQHDRLVGTRKLDSDTFQFFARKHASDKYPNADALAIDRISSAMGRQKAILKYRERHHAKLSQGIDPDSDGKSAILSETVVTDVFKEIPGHFSDMVSNGVSETSYGGTLLEGTGADAPRIPPIPKKGTEQKPFECPYCFYIITVRDKKAWARHIFRDLLPYVCIFPGCSTPNKLYGGRRQWYQHIQQEHASPTTTNGTYDCSICKQGSLPNAAFQRHVGQHLEELALFLLPRTDEEEDKEQHEDTDDEFANVSSGENSMDKSPEHRNDMDHAAPPASGSNAIDDHPSEELQGNSKPDAPPQESPLSSFQEILDKSRKQQDSEGKSQRRLDDIDDRLRDIGNAEFVADVVIDDTRYRERDLNEISTPEAEQNNGDVLKKKVVDEERQAAEAVQKRRQENLMKAAAVEEWKLKQELMKVKNEAEEKKEEQPEDKKHKLDEDIKNRTWIKTHRKHLLPETLMAYNLPWDWDDNDFNYLIIKKWVDEDVQEELFAHTRRLRKRKVFRGGSYPDAPEVDMGDIGDKAKPDPSRAEGGASRGRKPASRRS